jgi:hypothetical protein
MAESPNAHLRSRILELGAWRDRGHLFAVGVDGEVSKHEEHESEHDHESRQREEPPAAPAASAASAASEPAGEVGSKTLRERYRVHLEQVRLYFDLTTIETEEGLWLIAPMWPVGKPGPSFTVALYLPDHPSFTPTAFAFRSSGQLARAVGKRHTNSPEGSICAWSDGDIQWAPGESPFLLLRLYAEWLLCHLFYQVAGYWPGQQSALDGVYRWNEFDPREWCDCGSNKRYGECHRESDEALVRGLKAQGRSVAPPPREMPPSVVAFARSRWRNPPPPEDMPIRVLSAP